MKYISLVLWTFCLFLLMFSSFPLRVECRPSRVMGPGPPQNNHVLPKLLSSSPSSTHRTTCPFLEGSSVWPTHAEANADVYPIDITFKAWNADLVLEGTARSRSEVRADGTYGVTFDLSRIVKGDAPLLRRRRQFRLQFLDNPVNYSLSVGNMKNSIPATQLALHSNYPRSIGAVNSNLHVVSNLSLQHQPQLSVMSGNSGGSGAGGVRNIKKLGLSNSLQPPVWSGTTLSLNERQREGSVVAGDSTVVKRCTPPKAIIKTGRKYFVFINKLDSHFVPVFSPEIVNKKNTKVLNSTFCHGCEQPPGVVAPRELGLEPKKRLKLRCRLHKGFPIPTLIWYKDGKLIDFSDSRYRLRAKRRQSILVIRKAKQSDIGLYKCEAKNFLGSANANTRVIFPKVTSATTTTTVAPAPTAVTTTARPLPPLTSSACPYDAYCLNGGTCNYYPSILEYVCQCAEGYKGQRCDVKDIPTSGSMYLSYFCTFGTINPHYPCSPS